MTDELLKRVEEIQAISAVPKILETVAAMTGLRFVCIAHVTDDSWTACAVLDIIRADEGEVWVRELGFGMNRAFTRERRVDDIGTYERMCGIHLSLGAKHGVYPKPGFKRKDARYHIDVFAVTDAVYLGDERVYADGAWTV